MGIPSIRELTRRRESPGAVVVRRGLPVTIGLPLVTGAIVVVFLEEGWPATTIVATLLVGTMVTATAMLLWTAASVDEPYRRRTEAEVALRRSQEQHRALARSFPDGAVVLFDRDLRHLIADGVGLTAVGLSAEAMEGRTIWEVFPPDVCVTIEPFYRAALDGTDSQFEHTYRDRTYAVRVVPVSDEATQDVWGGAVTVADITDRKRSDRELGEATERFARIFENAPIGEAIATPEGRFLQVNRALCEALGYSERELLSLGFLDITHPDDRETSAAAAREAVDGVVRSYQLEKRYVHAQGHVVRARIRASLVRDDADRPAYFVTQIEDVTERLEAEERLHRAEQRYRTLVEQLPLVTYIRPLDLSAANVYCSPNVADVLGYTAPEWETDPGLLARIVHPDDVEHVLSEAAHVRSTGAPFRGEYRYVHRDGHVVWVQDETYLIRDEDGAPYGVQGYLLDITERKLAEAERDRLQSELQHAQKLEAIGQLAGGVAHEFNNTLTAIRGYATLVHEQLEEDSPLRRDVRQILGSAERAASLTRQLLAFGRKQVLNPRPIDLTAVTETTVELLRPLLDPAIVLATSLDPAIPPTRADPTQIEQVIVNLVLNASDAIAGHGTIDVTTRLTEVDAAQAAHHAVAAGTYIALGVSDTGCGMDEETRARIFEPFFTTKEEGKGTGLGLSTAYGLVRQGGGFLTVESVPARGTTMTMHLPLRPAAAPIPPTEPARGDGAERQGIAVVVDDERAVRTVCAALLTRLGFETREARDADEALALLEELDAVAVLLTDVVMPGSDGLELARKVATRRPETAVVTMSGYADRAGATRGVFLQKPFTMQELEERIDEALAAVADTRGETPVVTT